VRLVNLFTTKEKKMKKKLFALSGVFLIVLVLAGLWATKATDLFGVQQEIAPLTSSMASVQSMEQMARDATLIVIGHCTATQSRWVERSLVTDATILVTDRIKGDAAETLKVVLPGGIDSNRKFPLAMTYAGAPQISLDEDVFLFLNGLDDGANSYSVMGFAQGKFSINTDASGGKVVMRDMIKTPVQNGPGEIRGNLQSVSLSEFKEWVRKVLDR
jgi:hypothetical protein